MNLPQPPNESQLTPEQRKALVRIQRLIMENFKRGLVSVIYVGLDQKMHVQVVSNCMSKEENLDMAQRTLQEVQRAETGLITTLTPSERRISEQ